MTETYCVIELPSGRFFSIQREWRKNSETYRISESKSFIRCLVFGNIKDSLVERRLQEACQARNVSMPKRFSIRRVQASIVNG